MGQLAAMAIHRSHLAGHHHLDPKQEAATAYKEGPKGASHFRAVCFKAKRNPYRLAWVR